MDGKWTWSDGSPWEFENWASGQPDNNGHQDYVQINWQSVGGWDDMDVGANRGFICQFAGINYIAIIRNTFTFTILSFREKVC